MKKLNLAFLLTATASIFLASCAKDIKNVTTEQISDEPQTANYTPPGGYCGYTEFTLLAGQTINVGTIQVGNDAANLYVTYSVTAGYVISETHMYVGTLALLPVTNSGNAIPGQFPYNNSFGSAGVTSYTYTIPLSSLANENGCNIIAAHSVIKNAVGYSNFSQTGWISGIRINDGGNWAMFNTWCNASCVPVDPEK